MTNEIIFYTQIASIIGYVGAVFGLYRLLVSAKDGKIALLEERIKARDDKKQRTGSADARRGCRCAFVQDNDHHW